MEIAERLANTTNEILTEGSTEEIEVTPKAMTKKQTENWRFRALIFNINLFCQGCSVYES